MLRRSATFHVEDPEACSRALDSHAEFDGDQANGWAWIEPSELGDEFRPQIGFVEMFGDELLLETQSRERFERARQLLESLTGVVFVRVRTKEMHRSSTDPYPIDDRIPDIQSSARPSEDRIIQVQAAVDKRCMAWLDERNPAMQGQTPREAWASASTRRLVKQLIATFPELPPIAGLHTPREAMLRDLERGAGGTMGAS